MTSGSKLRLAYVKRGDPVDQLRRLGPSPPTLAAGGPDHYLSSVLRWVSGEPTLVVAYGARNQSAQSAHVKAQLIGPAFVSSALKPLTELFRAIRLFYMLIKFRPTGILCAGSDASLLASFLASRALGARFVHTRHERIKLTANDPLRWLLRRINLRVLRSADMIMCHGPFLERQLLDADVPKGKIVLFNNSYGHLIDDALVHSEDQNGALGERNILFTGRLTKNKGVFDLLDASEPLLREHSSVHLLFAGDGPCIDQLREAIAEKSLESQVKLLGYVPHIRLAGLIRKCDLVVTPTRQELPEGRPKSAIEALVLGKPVIAPNYGAFLYVVRHERNGLLYETDSVSDLREKLARFFSDHDGTWIAGLSEGIRESAQEMIRSEQDFGQALRLAFKGQELER